MLECVTPPGIIEPLPVAGTLRAPGRPLTVCAGSCGVCALLLLPLSLFHLTESLAFTRAQAGLAVRPRGVPLQDDGSGIIAGGWFVTIVYLPLAVSPLIGSFSSTDYSRQGEIQEK